MASEHKTLEKREAQAPQGAEWTRARKVFMPRADIYETENSMVVVADMPGVDEKAVDVTLENGVLTIYGRVEEAPPQGCELDWQEYEVGDFQRVFTLPNEIDQSAITAVVKNGVLTLTLPKAAEARLRKIEVKAE